MLTHIARAFDDELFRPTDKEGIPPRLLQWPYIRFFLQGRIGVSIFSMVTGYVCALKPIKLCRQGNQEAAFSAICKSALRRVPRLIMPTTIATAMIWFLAQFGAFIVGNRTDSWWIRYTSPNAVPYLGNAIMSLVHNIITTWTKGANIYDGNQWTMWPLLRGSMHVYAFMFAMAYVQPRYRMMASLGWWVYYYVGNDCTFYNPSPPFPG